MSTGSLATNCSSALVSFAETSGPEECGGNDGDAVGAAVGVSASGYDRRVEQVGAELSTQPMQVFHVGVVDRGTEFDLDSDDLMVVAFEDHIDLVVAVAGA